MTKEEAEIKVDEHIKMFEVVESHYVRKTDRHEYLPFELSVDDMHRMYEKWYVMKKYQKEDYKFYHRIFTEKFDLKFQKLIKGQM